MADTPADGARVVSDDTSASADSAATAAGPSVLAVVVSHAPGPWFDDVLHSLADQDYARLSVLVIDTAGDPELADRVQAVLPAATVLPAEATDGGYGATANRVLDEGPRAALYLFCHDDVALAPDAVSHLVDEVVRSNAAIVAPKLVMWDDPIRLQHVGLSVDKFGVSAPLADEGEIDQAQRDAVADVFAVPGACLLVRADLFRTLGGFDAGMRFRGDDVDLCWRAQIAGARVMVVPDAVARHRERLADRRVIDDTRRMATRHAVRSMLSCWGIGRLLRIVPQALALTVVEVLYAVAHGRFRHARELLGAWTWNFGRLGEIHRRRRSIAAFRQVSDAEVHGLQVRGSARLRSYFRGQLGRDDERVSSLTNAGRELASSLRSGPTRQAVAGLGVLTLLLLVGSRRLLVDPIPAVGELQPLTGGTGVLFHEWWRGWHTRALGSSSAAPGAHGLLALLGVPLFGHAALLRTVLVLAPLPVAAFGMWRLTRPFGSRRANLVGVAVYLAMPVVYNGYAQGSLAVLVVYGAAPWLLAGFGRLIGTAPFAPRGPRGGSFSHRVLALGLLVALVVAFVPFAVAVVAVVMGGLLVGSLVAGDGRGVVTLFFGTVLALVAVFVLHLPWSLSFVRDGSTWASFAQAGSARGDRVDLADLVRFHTGQFGARPLSYAVLVAAGFPLLLAQGVRLAWAVRGWFVALGCWAVVWAAGQGWLPRALPNPGVLLAPGAAGLALATALGVAAFEIDLHRHRFGWRQLAPFAAAGAVAMLLVPFLVGTVDGRWKMPRRDFERSYAGLFAHPEEGTPRVLWIGDPAILPVAGFDLARGALATSAVGLAYATTDGRAPTLLDRWGGPDTTGAQLVREAIARAASGDTNRLGQLLAVFGIRYVVVADHLVPAPLRGEVRPVPPVIGRTFGAQLDLERVESVNEAVTVYRNNSWIPIRAVLASGTDFTADPLAGTSRLTDRTNAIPALVVTSPDGIRATGPLAAGARLYLATNASTNWRLRVAGGDVARSDALGWANVFEPATAADASLDYSTPRSTRLMLVGQVVIWLLALARLNALRERRRSS